MTYLLSRKCMAQRTTLLLLLLLLCCLPGQASAASSIYTISKVWTGLTSPITTYHSSAPEPRGFTITIDGKPTRSMVSTMHRYHAIVQNLKGKDLRETNLIARLMTLNDKKKLEDMNAAYLGGRLFTPYAIFTYDQNGEAYYWARYTDACTVYVYGHSWFSNIPARILNTLESYIVLYKQQSAHKQTDDKAKYLPLLDMLISILSLFIEIPLAFGNTLVGMVIAAIANPWESFCSLPGLLYFSLAASWYAGLDVALDIFTIPYHLLS